MRIDSSKQDLRSFNLGVSMNKECSECQKSFTVSKSDLDFYKQVSPVVNSERFDIPAPNNCPDCRQQRRLAIANERFFYIRECGLCEKRMMSEHPSSKSSSGKEKKEVYCRDCWFSDQWDSTDYGREVDFTRPMFEQFKELQKAVPSQNLVIEGTNVNSDYIHYAGFCKNSYLVSHSDFCEDCYYGYGFKKNTSCVDGFYNLSSELCYDCVDVFKCYNLIGSQDCNNCTDSKFIRDCIGCKNCFLCAGLRGKSYCINNKQLTKEKYLDYISKLDFASYRQYQALKLELDKLSKKHSFKEFHGNNTENCQGDYITNCKEVFNSFDCEDVESGRYLYQVVTGAKNVQDIYQYGLNLRESYQCSIAGNNVYHALFSHNVHLNCNDVYYCWYLHSSSNCFGCFNMHHKKYCILNKQYSKQEYEELLPKVIKHMIRTGEWGDFFPISFSPFGYNKTNAQLYYPLEKEEALCKGWKWEDDNEKKNKNINLVAAENLPDSISDVDEDILNQTLECSETQKAFKITPQELKFYKKQNIPLPRICPEQRHLGRFNKRNKRVFNQSNCLKCSQEVLTTYNTNESKVLCEQCYFEETY